MRSRTDWSLADRDVEWSSVRVNPDASPRGWQQEQADGSVVLKCTARGVYHNSLPSPNTFLYELPPRRRGADETLSERLLSESGAEHKRLEVRLFWAQNAWDHYLGEWVVHGAQITPVRTSLVLRRLAVQSDVILRAYRHTHKRARSHSEARHLGEIRAWLPGWTIAHEPETAVGLDAPVVVRGALQDFAGDAYTHDYVAASPRGCRRICIESKANDEGLTEEAKQKCRRLRDGTLCRVVAMVSHGPSLHWYDFGPPGSQQAAERVYHEQRELDAALGIVGIVGIVNDETRASTADVAPASTQRSSQSPLPSPLPSEEGRPR